LRSLLGDRSATKLSNPKPSSAKPAATKARKPSKK